jgi:hypothetical protein
MLNQFNLAKIAAVVVCISALSACGGGGSGGNSSPTPSPTPVPNSVPTASNIIISDTNGGDALSGDNIVASYQFNDADGDPEGNSVYQWLRNGAAISAATSLTYQLSDSDAGTNITFQVTPVAASGNTTGTATQSSALAVQEIVQGPNKDEFMSSLSTWSEFAPKAKPESDEGQEIIDDTVAPMVEEVTNEEGIVKVCTTESVDFFKSPAEYVMFTPPTNILYPGAFVEGKSIRDGNRAGDILPLNIQQRTNIKVSIPACTFANNYREVSPSQANVNSAVGAIIAEALALGLDCVEPRGNLVVETYRNEQQRALKAGFSGKYFGFSGSASGSYSKTSTQSSVAAVFRESLYTVQIEAPQTPGEWFTDEFTPARIKALEDAGRMSNTNIPAYVAQVTYGRMLTSTFTSSYSETDMRAAIEFKYANPAGSVQGDAAARSQTIRENSSTTLAYLGGSAAATSAMLKSNDWTEYFSKPVTAADAVPISFELRSTSDNTLAVTQEITNYERTSCFDKVADNATFVFQAKQNFTTDFSGVGQKVALGDVNGDGADDIVWVSTNSSGFGEMALALANGDGSFKPVVKSINSAATGYSGEMFLLLADIDNDGRDDIVLNILKDASSKGNVVFVSFYKGDGDDAEFVHSVEQDMEGGAGWNFYSVFSGQMDKQRGQDLIWNNVPNSTSTNRTYIAHAVDTTTVGFDLTTDALFVRSPYLDITGNFSGYETTTINDFDGDGYGDILWQNLSSADNVMYIRNGTATGLTASKAYKAGFGGWQSYLSLFGDIDGDGRSDVVNPRHNDKFADFGIHARNGQARQSVGFSTSQFIKYSGSSEEVLKPFFGEAAAVNPDLFLADVNGDGAQDFIVNEKGKVDALANNIAVGLSIAGSNSFSFARAAQKVPQSEDWSQYTLYIADVNGDTRDDVVWVLNAATNSIFVGVARNH